MTHRNTQGFTLVELMLSMAFLSVLLLAIALLVLQISSIYNKGLTLREVNEAGQLIASDVQRTLNTVTPASTKQVQDDALTPTGGRLCAGQTVYAWNFGKFLGQSTTFNKRVNNSSDIRLVKFASEGVDYCTPVSGTYRAIPNQAGNLLVSGDKNIALHTFSFSDQLVSGDSTQHMYHIQMVIGTNETSVINGNGCRIPESKIDDEYCAVNEFNFAARSGNK